MAVLFFTLLSERHNHSGDIVHHVQQHFQFRFQLRHYSLLPYQKLQARQLRQLEQNIQALPVLIYTFMELRAGISLAAIEQWGFTVFDPVYYKNVNFTLPLSVNGTFCAFSTGYDAKGSTFLWHSMSHFNNVNVGVTGFVFDSRYTFTGLGYLAVCWQKQWGKPTVRGNNIFPIPFPNSALAITSAGIGGWHTVDVSIVNNNSYSVLGWATDSPSAARTSLPNVIAIGF